jgi:hypothetical protein
MSKFRNKIHIIDWSINVWSVRKRKEFLESFDDNKDMEALAYEHLPKNLADQIEEYIINKYDYKL